MLNKQELTNIQKCLTNVKRNQHTSLTQQAAAQIKNSIYTILLGLTVKKKLCVYFMCKGNL